MMRIIHGNLSILIVITVVVLLLPITFANVIIKSLTDTDGQASLAYDDYDAEKDDYITYWVELIVLESYRAALTVDYNSNQSEMKRESIELASDAIPTDFAIFSNIKDTAKNAAKFAITYSDGISLKKALILQTIEIQKKKVDVAKQMEVMNDYYDHYVLHINAFNESKETISDNKNPTKKGRIPSDEIGVDTDLEVMCSNARCPEIYRASTWGIDNIVSLSEGGSYGSHIGHLYMCPKFHAYQHKHQSIKFHTHNKTAPSYWICPNDGIQNLCPQAEFHAKLCPGSCGKYNGILLLSISGNSHGYRFIHLKGCTEKVSGNILNLFNSECSGTYYTCVGSSGCTNATNHIDDDDTTGSNPSTPPTPTMHVCGVHESTVSGSHSSTTPPCGVSDHANYACQISSTHKDTVSCPKDSNNQECTYQTYYACSEHVHAYPTPPAPPTVSCGRSACVESVSSSTEHKDSCVSGHSWWSCDKYADHNAKKHRVRTCRYTECRQSWQNCMTDNPVCNKSNRKAQGKKCWAEDV